VSSIASDSPLHLWCPEWVLLWALSALLLWLALSCFRTNVLVFEFIEFNLVSKWCKMAARVFIGLLCTSVHSSLPIYFQTVRNIKFVCVYAGSLYLFDCPQLKRDFAGTYGTTHRISLKFLFLGQVRGGTGWSDITPDGKRTSQIHPTWNITYDRGLLALSTIDVVRVSRCDVRPCQTPVHHQLRVTAI
jgi:hypothetical protein